jgi:hypothetical protein
MDFARLTDGDLKLLATSSEEGKARWAALVKRTGLLSSIAVVPFLSHESSVPAEDRVGRDDGGDLL